MTDTRGLDVSIVGGELMIRIGVKTLAVCAEQSPVPEFSDFDEGTGKELRPTVTDPAVFASEVLRELLYEQEDGTTPVHELLDRAMLDAVENGAEGIRWWNDPQV